MNVCLGKTPLRDKKKITRTRLFLSFGLLRLMTRLGSAWQLLRQSIFFKDVHSWRQLYELWLEALQEGLRALLEWVQYITLLMFHKSAATKAFARSPHNTLTRLFITPPTSIWFTFPNSICAGAYVPIGNIVFVLQTFSDTYHESETPWGDMEYSAFSSANFLPELQWAVGEMWAAVLRRLKAGPRDYH